MFDDLLFFSTSFQLMSHCNKIPITYFYIILFPQKIASKVPKSVMTELMLILFRFIIYNRLCILLNEFKFISVFKGIWQYVSTRILIDFFFIGHLLLLFTPVIIEVCLNPNKYPDINSRASASLALTKFMLVSSEFCDENFFTVLEVNMI